jgi:hypothetical protein
MNPNFSTKSAAPSDIETDRWHTDDLHAAKIVVGLMTGVFVIGLLMYSFIMFVVM